MVVQVGDAIFNAVPSQWLKDDFDHLRIPHEMRPLFPAVKSASAVGLYLGLRRPALGRLTAAALIVYFVLALGAHARVKDPALKAVPAAGMLAWSIVAFRAFSGAATPAR
ncbi:MAG: DoxX family protein [Acidimicrobiia bacterium]|nr:DoxX family protein [Acidimicrobiia bacterium]